MLVHKALIWGDHYQRSFFDAKVFNPNASSYCKTAASSLYRKFEHDKQRMYEQCIGDVEMGSFTPLVISTFGEWVVWLQLCISG